MDLLLRSASLLAVALLTLPRPASAGPSAAQKCSAAKLTAISKAVAATIKCRKAAVLRSTPVDSECLAKAEAKLTAAFAKAESKGECALTGDLPDHQHGVDVCVDLFADLESLPCGDEAGPAGEDIPCSCAGTVVTNTVLDEGFDLVVSTTCAGNGLRVAGNVTLDLNGATIGGAGTGTGVSPGDGATVHNGSVQGFDTGIAVGEGSATLTNVALNGNVGPGLVVGLTGAPTGATVALGGPAVSVSDNGSSGIVVHAGAALEIAGESALARLPILRNGGYGMEVRGQLLASHVTSSENAGTGILVDSDSPVKLVNSELSDNAADGIHVRGAPGLSNLDDGTLALDPENYGFTMNGPDTLVSNNGGHGIHLGDPDQTNDVSAFFDLGAVNFNSGAGIFVEQNADVAPGDDCGASAGYPGCTGATIHGVIIHDNAGPGVELRTSFLMPRKIGSTFYGLGFTSNRIFHNAIGSGCSSAQTQPQVMVRGPVGLSGASCAAAADAAACENANNPVNQHCYWTGATCIVTWDLRGAQDCDDNTANPNEIHSYNTNTDPLGSSELSVGLYASSDSTGVGAVVWADNNSWRTGDESQNVDQDAFSFVDADTICPAGGILLQCSDF